MLSMIALWLIDPSNYCTILGNLYQKKKGNFLISKTWPVHYMNIRANNRNKRFDQDLMKSVEEKNGILKMNYGVQKAMRSTMQSANTVITFDLFCQERRSGSSCIVDQKSDHDLAIHSIFSLQCIQKLSNPGRTTIYFSTLRNLATTIKMNFGTNMEASGGTYYLFTVDLNHPCLQHEISLQGMGQGNG